MGVQRFEAQVVAGLRCRGVIAVPFDPDAEWGAKAEHHVGGTINDQKVRGTITPGDNGWVLTLGSMWMRDAQITTGEHVTVEVEPEGPQRGDLADDVAAAIAANPKAAAFYDTLAQFYRKAYLKWIDSTRRRPELRQVRIAEVVGLLETGIKERPRS